MPSIYIDSELVPQANDLAKVFRVGSYVATGSIPTSEELGVDPRQVDYYLNAARALGIVVGDRKEDLRISDDGRHLLSKRDDRRILVAAKMFERSKCGVEWLRWAGKPSLLKLSPTTAEEFVRNIRGVSGETVGRRAQTLAAWLREFQAALSASDSPRPSQRSPVVTSKSPLEPSSVPNALLQAFVVATSKLPKTTEAERLVVQRVGQDIFRAGLLEYWKGKCAITGLAVTGLLRASHIKPWAACEMDAERLDVFNGLLLAPHLDAAFDQGFLTVEDDGVVVVSAKVPGKARRVLGLDDVLRVRRLDERHRGYLPWHRERVFKR